ncbi:protein FAR-RED IMPAIRED RESPONSE 1-like [Tripterygium wilfordii]|uniref:protein FAR-RED IMPAIRED RESPONSE 1-like n=1 Tax=Tripterygium wilfordii TaxID=458696 RepID=UPI0018F7E9B8|nr:protein FAR-RED IMPAIRED RESPONSE 1-like [Tripterygium wilfordii]
MAFIIPFFLRVEDIHGSDYSIVLIMFFICFRAQNLEDSKFRDQEVIGLNCQSPEVDVSCWCGTEKDLKVFMPARGMLFDREEEMFEFYKKYGEVNGFPVKRRTSNKDKDGLCKYVTFTCARAGLLISRAKNIINHRSSQKSGCKARLRARLSCEGKWEITSFEDCHNHVLSPSQSRFFICNREINPHVQRQLEINDIAGIRPNKSHSAQVIGAGGHENLTFLQKDTRNLIAKVRRLRMGEGDAKALQSYFDKMQSKNEGFYSLIDWDQEGRMKSVFWADPRSRAACHEFGDVITFDTTYLTNKYDMPFAPFVGVNHHGQSILLGCGLLSNEDIDSFIWLFRTWLSCMHGVAPKGIVTDQDKAMKSAIEIVFPGIRHRWCLWHILKKVPEKLGSLKDCNRITYLIGDAVFDSQSIEQFESSWKLMVESFRLEANVWLSLLYEDRARWVPIYLKNFFWQVCMSTTQRSESINAFFDGYVNSKTTLKQFVEQYNNALRDKVEKESLADYNSIHRQLQCGTSLDMEKQILNLYNESKFKEFQIELFGMMYCGIILVENNAEFIMFHVEEDIVFGEKGRKKIVFSVFFDEVTCSVKCSCCNYEFRGILCRHATIVLIRNRRYLVPDQYIFRRWRKDVRRCHSRVKINYEGWIITSEQRRYDELCRLFTSVADLAAMSEEKYKLLITLIEDASSKMTTNVGNHVLPGPSENDPLIRRTKGRPRSLRKEKIFKRKRVGNARDEATSSTAPT